jgi:hypothetical protein
MEILITMVVACKYMISHRHWCRKFNRICSPMDAGACQTDRSEPRIEFLACIGTLEDYLKRFSWR